MQSRTAEEEHRQRNHQGRAVSDHRTGNGLRNRGIDDFHRRAFTDLTEAFTTAVENNHGLVDRVTQNRKNGRQNRQREFPLEQREDTEHQENVMHIAIMAATANFHSKRKAK